MGIDPREVDPSDIHSFNRYAYGNNNPMRYVDRNGMWAEDVFLGLPSLAVGAHSLWGNVKQGNWAGAAVDVAGMVADAAAIVAPGVPGGVGLGIKATREGAEVAVQAAAKGAVDGLGFTRSQLQHAFKHSKDFGVTGNANNKTLSEFSSALQSHVDAAGTRAIQGAYRGNPVTHHVDPSTGLNVIRDSSGNFLSGWKLSPQQLQHVLTTGKLGGLMSTLVDYERLLEQFLSGAMPVEEFQATYLDRFKNEGQLDESLFELLDELFGDVDSFTTDPQLLAENPGFYLDEAGLRQKVRQAAARLSDLKR
jgi:hypothetical protein